MVASGEVFQPTSAWGKRQCNTSFNDWYAFEFLPQHFGERGALNLRVIEECLLDEASSCATILENACGIGFHIN